MVVIPSIDIRGGRVVRLLKGDFQRETVYVGDPVQVARDHAHAGASRLHLVDLDAARGGPGDRSLVAEIVASAGLGVQVAGGVRALADVEAWLGAGAAAVAMGTAAVRDPALLARCAQAHPGKVIAALDVRAGRPAVTGWTAVEEVDLEPLLRRWDLAPLAGVILTCIDRDGTLEGPDLETLARVLAATRHPVTYSAGIGSLEHLRQVAEAGATAVILGKAVYEGRVDLREAIAALA